MPSNNDLWIAQFKEHGALWFHSGNPKQPHALLTSGKHSNGFVNCTRVIEIPRLLKNCSRALTCAFETEPDTLFDPPQTLRVMGPAMGAIILAHVIAEAFSTLYRMNVKSGYFEKSGDQMTIPRSDVQQGDNILLVEDVLTTGGSAARAERAVIEKGANVLPFILALVNRTEEQIVNDKRVISLIHKPMQTWEPNECPLCSQGSETLRPKGTEAWARLNAEY
jgi:orotate phosphoribosyltransferase